MRQTHFSGRVLPERTCFGLSDPLITELLTQDSSWVAAVTVSIQYGQVSVLVNEKIGALDIDTLKNVAEEHVRAIIDAFGYIEGCGYDVEITSAVLEDGKHLVFGVNCDAVRLTKSERPLDFNKTWKASSRSIPLRHALADLREAIRSPHDSGFLCYRAVDGIMQGAFRNGEKEDRGWERLRAALRIDRSYLMHIKSFADVRRHGGAAAITSGDRMRVMQYAWRVVDRFVQYVDQGEKPLSAAVTELKHP